MIEQTIREQLPDGFQRAEYLRNHGMIDMVVHRHDLRATLARLCGLLMRTPPENEIGVAVREIPTRTEAELQLIEDPSPNRT